MNTDHDVRELLERMAREPAIGPIDPEPMVRRAHRRLARTAVLGFACVALLAGVAIGGANLVLSSPSVPADTERGSPPDPSRRRGADPELRQRPARGGRSEHRGSAHDPGLRGRSDPRRGCMRRHRRPRDIRRWPMARLRHRLWWFLPARDRDLGDERTRGQAPTDGGRSVTALGLVATGLHARDVRGRRGVRAGHDRPADGGSNDGREPERRGREPWPGHPTEPRSSTRRRPRTRRLESVDLESGDMTELADVGGGAIAWSPDGSQIAFDDYRGGQGRIIVMNRDGSDQHVLVDKQPDRSGARPPGPPTAPRSRTR